MPITTGFITGTGFYTLPSLQETEHRVVQTPYGEVQVEIGSVQGQEVAFIPRHGKGHTLAPNQIPYRANIYALYSLGVQRVLSTAVSGSLVEAWGPGTLVALDQFLNFSTGRADSFYPMDGKLAHIDVTEPYCPTLRRTMLEQGEALGMEIHPTGTYACFDGPRFETRAEIAMVRQLGGHLVGQTNYPESVLARELAICYATVAVVSNHAAGIQPNVTATEVMQNLRETNPRVDLLFERVLLSLPEPYDCSCRHVLDEAFL